MRSIAELATQLREFWLRDFGAAATTYSSADAGSISLTNTLFIATSGGYVGINTLPEAPYALDIVGNVRIAGNLLDRSGNSWTIGSEDNPWGAIYAADLHVGNLIAENKIATIGGRVVVSPSTKLTAAVAAIDTTIDVAANTLASGDRIYFESTGRLEWMAVTSGATALTVGYRYSVTRNLNGAGAQTWKAGDAVVNTGTTGQGFIDLYSRYGIPASGETSTTRVGPTIVGNVRTSSTYNHIAERWAVGNLNGLYDYVVTAYGLAAGDPTTTWFALDASNGLRMMRASTTRVQLTAAGVFTINDSSGAAVFTFNASAGAEFTLPLTLATTGGIYQGTGTFASPTTGLKIYNDTGIGKIAGYNSGTAQWYADTDGKLYAGGGKVWMDSTGLNFNLGTSYSANAAVKWGVNVQIYGMISGGVNRLYSISSQPGTGTIAENNIYAQGGSSGGGGASVVLYAEGNGASSSFTIYSTGNHVLYGNMGFKGATSGTAKVTAAAVAGTPTLTLPTSTGTLALTSDITTAVVGTSGYMAKFTGTNAVGNSIVSESGSAVLWTGTLKLKGAGAGYNIFSPPNIGADVTLTLPSTSGTLALTSAAYVHPNHSGDATSVADGAITFASVNSNVGTFGSTTQSVQVTVNAKGLITAISNQTIAAGVGGSGTTGTIAKFSASTTLTNSILTETGTQLTVAGSFLFSSVAAPGSPAAGETWQDSTQKALSARLAGITQNLVGTIFTGTADKNVGNTATETTILPTGVGTLTLPANFWVVGKTVRITLMGYDYLGSGPARIIKSKLGSTTITTQTTTLAAGGGTKKGVQINIVLTCRTTGASGTIQGQQLVLFENGGNYGSQTSATVTVNTTASAALDVTYKFPAADINDRIVITNASIEVLN